MELLVDIIVVPFIKILIIMYFTEKLKQGVRLAEDLT